MQTLRQDLRHAMRTLSRRPGLAAVCVATLALGLGGATAIFSVADAVVLRPLPFADPDRIVLVRQSDARRGHPTVEIGYPAFRAWRDESRSFTSIAGMPNTNQAFVLTGGSEPVRIMGRWVTAAFFDVLGVQPVLGRGFTADDDRPGAPRVVVLSDALWRERFGADPSVIGRALTFDGLPAHTVVGVMPRGFDYPRQTELWTPLGPAAEWALDNPGVWWMAAIGRLAPGATAATARTELNGIWTRLYGPHIDATGFGVVLTPVTDAVLGSSRAALLALLAAVVLVLLIACANVAGLQIVQAVERRTEWAVRQALGASRARLARMLMAESLLLTALGGFGGAVLAAWGTPLLVAVAPADVPRLDQVALDARALLFGLAACAATGLLSALAPLLLVRRSSLDDAFRAGARTVAPASSRLRATLVVTEVALSFVLLVGAGLLARTLANLHQVPLGFDADRVLAMDVTIPEARYDSAAKWRGFYERLLERTRSLPGVESAAIVTLRPLWGPVGMDWPFTVEGQSEKDAARNPLLNLEAVSPEYFRTMGIPIRLGRALRETDDDAHPGAVVVSESMARRYWPGVDPIGQRLKLPMPDTPFHDAWLTVVGVAGDARYRELEASRLDLYMSYRQADHRPHHVVVRTGVAPAAMAGSVRDVVRGLDADVPVTDVLALSDAVSEALGNPRFAALVFAGFALVAVLLAALGLYGLLAYSVSRRTREIGVRVALGARAAQVRRLVLREGIGLTAAGLAIGLLAAAAAARMLESLLFGVGAADTITFAAAAAVLALVTVAACLLPARRAARVDPAVALRTE